MCGIAGIFQFRKGNNHHDALHRMIHCQAHRGPDGQGAYEEPSDGIYLGHLRLSIIDLSAQASQPMKDADDRYMLIFNGEIYNYQEIRSGISDYPFKTQSDSEVILASYRKWGKDCVKYFNGIFGLAIWDKKEKSLFISRDQLGIKPVYFALDPDKIVFASEIRALLSSGLLPKKINQSALYDYLTYQSTLGSDTLIENIIRLEPGHSLFIKNGKMEKFQYWDLLAERKFEFENQESVQRQVKEKVLGAVRRQMVSDVPIAAFLSGGIDSSIMVACMALQSDQPVNTFTLAFDEQQYDESEHAEVIAKKYKTNHHKINLASNDILEQIPNIIYQMDNPSGDGINSYIVSAAIRNAGMKVAISGLGGDELFAGYGYAKMYKRVIDQNGMWSFSKPLRHLGARILSKAKSSSKQKFSQILKTDHPSLHTLYPVFRAVFSKPEINKILQDRGTGGLFIKYLASHESDLSRLPGLSRFSAGDILGYTEGVLLKDSDQMSMANSIELRVPFFDIDLVEYVMAIPDTYKNPVTPKKLLVDAMDQMIPESIWNRKKMGFTLPWNTWLRGELHTYCKNALNDLADRGLMNGSVIRDYLARFEKNDSSVSWSRIWTLVVLEKWMQQHLDVPAYA